jgi:hypothetical protein
MQLNHPSWLKVYDVMQKFQEGTQSRVPSCISRAALLSCQLQNSLSHSAIGLRNNASNRAAALPKAQTDDTLEQSWKD